MVLWLCVFMLCEVGDVTNAGREEDDGNRNASRRGVCEGVTEKKKARKQERQTEENVTEGRKVAGY